MSQRKYRIVDVLAGMLILGSLQWLLSDYINFKYYRGLFEHLSDRQALFRYVSSVIGKIIGIIAGIGLIYRVHIWRKVVIVLCAFTVLTIYWKHPVIILEKAFTNLTRYGIDIKELGVDLELLIRITISYIWTVDISYACVTILVLTNRSIIKCFR